MSIKELNLDEWYFFSDRHNSIVYISNDEKWLVKLFAPGFGDSLEDLQKEQAFSRRVYDMGVRTPDVGEIVRVGDKVGLVFENIQNKTSFSRQIKNDPDSIEEVGRNFARLCKGLHQTECDTGFFPSRKGMLLKFAEECDIVSEEERARIIAFLKALPDDTKCIHGDLHTGNAIFNDDGEYFIDLGMFAYGDPILDVSIFYAFSHFMPEFVKENIFYTNGEGARKLWESFAEEYFGVKSGSPEMEDLDRRMAPIASMNLLLFHDKKPMPFDRGLFEQFMLPTI